MGGIDDCMIESPTCQSLIMGQKVFNDAYMDIEITHHIVGQVQQSVEVNLSRTA